MHYGMRTPDGNEMWGKWIYREIVKPERLVVVASFSDAQRGITRHPLSPEWPLETPSWNTTAPAPRERASAKSISARPLSRCRRRCCKLITNAASTAQAGIREGFRMKAV